jgi:SAM-dependent methyltransferase
VTATEAHDPVIWHDVECGGFEADLPIWEELATKVDPILELGCGSGRVGLHLAQRGHEVWGIDKDPALIAELRERAGSAGLEIHAVLADAAGFDLDRQFGLIAAPMQLIQLLPDREARLRCLGAIAAHLAPGGRAALAIVESSETGIPPSPPLPDVREREGWVYSSMPLGIVREDDALLIERLRQSVDPDGHLDESRDTVRLCVLAATQLEQEADDAGMRPAGHLQVGPTDAHVGSTVVLLEGGG